LGFDAWVMGGHWVCAEEKLICNLSPPKKKQKQKPLQKLIQSGAKTIIVGNQPPQGCNPAILTTTSGIPGLTKDSNGCLIEYNQVDIEFNSQLQFQLTILQALHLGITIIQFDFYSAIYELITNPAEYGIFHYIHITFHSIVFFFFNNIMILHPPKSSKPI
jgi:phospholipase/lecithinase/hemolysin